MPPIVRFRASAISATLLPSRSNFGKDRTQDYAALAASLERQQNFNEKANPERRSTDHLFEPRQVPTLALEQNNERHQDQER